MSHTVKMALIDVWFSDLTEEAQQRILKARNIRDPKEANWDVFSIGKL